VFYIPIEMDENGVRKEGTLLVMTTFTLTFDVLIAGSSS